MATLQCCLVGFDAVSVSTVQGLAHLFSEQLAVEWEFRAGLGTPCHLLVCDVDTPAGEQAWRTHGFGFARVLATAGGQGGHTLVLRKPFRGYGPDGLIHVLNEGARMQAERAGPAEPATPAPAAPPPAPAPRRGGWFRSALRSLPRIFTGFTHLPDYGPAPVRAAAPAAAPEPVVPPWQPPPEPVDIPRYRPMPAYAEADADAEPVAMPAGSTALTLRVPEPALVGEVVPHRGRAHSHPGTDLALAPEVVEVNLLTALRRFRSLSQVAVIRFEDVPTICVVSETEMFYSLASLQKMYELPPSSLTPARVTIARNSHQGRKEAQSYYQSGSQSYFVSMPATPLKHLFWVATLRCAGTDELAHYGTGAYRFKMWPDLALLPHEPFHVTWCGLLARQAVTVASLAASTGNTPLQAAVFLSACEELGILERSSSAPTLLIGSEHPSDRNKVFRSFLNRLGFSRP